MNIELIQPYKASNTRNYIKTPLCLHNSSSFLYNLFCLSNKKKQKEQFLRFFSCSCFNFEINFLNCLCFCCFCCCTYWKSVYVIIQKKKFDVKFFLYDKSTQPYPFFLCCILYVFLIWLYMNRCAHLELYNP